jgi:hypothetical protein
MDTLKDIMRLINVLASIAICFTLIIAGLTPTIDKPNFIFILLLAAYATANAILSINDNK